jgi:hypothetical protein
LPECRDGTLDLACIPRIDRAQPVLLKRRHPEVQAEIDASIKSIWRSSAKGDATRQRKMIDCGKPDIENQCGRSRF